MSFFLRNARVSRARPARTRIAIGLLACSLAFASLHSPPAHAQTTDGNPAPGAYDVGALLGVTWANHGYGSSVAWGVTGHYTVMPNLNVGLYYERFTSTTTVLSAGGTQYTTSFNFITAEANYLLTGIIDGAYVGAKFGWAITSVSLPNVNDANNVVFGPALGYDYSFGSGFSLGGQFNILWRSGTPFVTDPNLIAILKYTFG